MKILALRIYSRDYSEKQNRGIARHSQAQLGDAYVTGGCMVSACERQASARRVLGRQPACTDGLRVAAVAATGAPPVSQDLNKSGKKIKIQYIYFIFLA